MRLPDRPVVVAVAVVVAAALGGAIWLARSEPAEVLDRSFAQAELETEVADRFPSENPEKEVEVRCAGGLEGVEGATQSCRVTIGSDPADVRVEVTGVDGTEVLIGTTPYVPPIRVAGKVRDALVRDEYVVRTVICSGDLLGVVGEQVTCTVKPANDRGEVTATVTEVDGLTVAFRYDVVGDS